MAISKVTGVVERVHFDSTQTPQFVVVLRPDSDNYKDIRYLELSLRGSVLRDYGTQLRLTQPGDHVRMTVDASSMFSVLDAFENLSLNSYLAACPTYPA